MRISSAPSPSKPLDRATARNCLLTNLVVLPGLGSIMAGRVVGWLQAPLAVAGFVLTNVWAISFAVAWFRTGEFPQSGGAHFRLALFGVTLFGIGWLWALGTGLSILRRSCRGDS